MLKEIALLLTKRVATLRRPILLLIERTELQRMGGSKVVRSAARLKEFLLVGTIKRAAMSRGTAFLLTGCAATLEETPLVLPKRTKLRAMRRRRAVRSAAVLKRTALLPVGIFKVSAMWRGAASLLAESAVIVRGTSCLLVEIVNV